MIPENEAEEKESDGLKFDCHVNHAEALRQSTRYLDALSEIKIIGSMHDNEKWRSEKLPAVTELKATILLNLQRYDEALDALGLHKDDGKHPYQ